MKKNNKQTRREFLKKGCQKVLPILTIASCAQLFKGCGLYSPFMNNPQNSWVGCPWSCTTVCMDNCNNNCRGACKDSCGNGCSGGCYGTCNTTCNITCFSNVAFDLE